MKVFAAIIFLAGALMLPVNGEVESIHRPENVIVPSVEFVDTPIADAIAFLSMRSRELDTHEADLDLRGFDVVLVGNFRDATVTMHLQKVPLIVALRTTAELAGARVDARREYFVVSKTRLPEVVHSLPGSEETQSKLNQIKIPSVEFHSTPLQDVVNFLRVRALELDTKTPPAERGVNLVLKNPDAELVSASLKNVSLGSVLEVVALQTGYTMEIREHLVMLKPRQ